MEDQDEVEPDEADLEFITSILDSFSQPNTTPALHHHKRGISLHKKSFLENAPFQSRTKPEVMPPEFNYDSIIKAPATKNFSCKPTLDLDTADHWNKIDVEPKIPRLLKAPQISNITESRSGNRFSTWCSFIPSKLDANTLQSSPTWPSSRQSSSLQSFSPESLHKHASADSPFTTNWHPKISSVAYSQPDKIRNWKQHYLPVYLAKLTNLCPSAPQLRWRQFKKEQRFSINKWIKHLPGSIRLSGTIAKWQNKLPDHPGQSKQSRIWTPPLPCLPLPDQLQSTRSPNTQPEISNGDVLLLHIQSQSRDYCSMISKHARRKTNYLVRKSKELCHKTRHWPNRLPAFMTLLQRN